MTREEILATKRKHNPDIKCISIMNYEVKNVQKQSTTPKKLIVDEGDLPDAAPKDSV